MSPKTPANESPAIAATFSIAAGTGSSSTGGVGLSNDQTASTRKPLVNRFNSYFLPFALAGAFFAPTDRTAIERVVFSPTSPIRQFGRHNYWADEDAWTYAPEFVSLDQVRALNALFSLPAPVELPSFVLDEE